MSKRRMRKQKGGWGGIPSFIVNAKGYNHGIMGRKRKRSALQLAMQAAVKKRKKQNGGRIGKIHKTKQHNCCIM